VGYSVSEASNGAEGLDIFRSKNVDVVVTDIIMPEKGGIDTIMDLRRDYPDSKIIAISGGGMCGEVSYLDMAIGVGADRAIGKPFVLDEFLGAVRELVEGEPVGSES
jgi:YesN/AraC family two-component response regulator